MSKSIKESNFKQFVIICILLVGVIASLLLVFQTLTVKDIGCSKDPVNYAEEKYDVGCTCFGNATNSENEPFIVAYKDRDGARQTNFSFNVT
ncbi:MAG: hypothetical protein ABEI74_04835 [Candidatus Pacearchaeota archaeon]